MPTDFTTTVLTIAGSDPYGGAGLQIDTKVIHALGAYAFSVTTALSAQNSFGVSSVDVSAGAIFAQQLDTLLSDVKVDAVKIGMLGNRELIHIVCEMIDKYQLHNIVLDTVFLSSSGAMLLEEEAIEEMQNELFPRVDLITPNLAEINRILGTSYKGEKNEVKEIAEHFLARGIKTVLVKGGHGLDEINATDYLIENGLLSHTFTSSRVQTTHTHGTGCFLSAAIATGLAKGQTLSKSIAEAKDFLTQRLKDSASLKFKYVKKNEIRKEPLL